MSLQERLAEDVKNAMRQHDDVRRDTLRMVRSAVRYEEINQQKPLDDAGVINVLAKMARQHQESIAEFTRGNRPEMVKKEEAELVIVRSYMPQQLTREELAELARKAIAEVGAKGPQDMSKVMGKMMPQVRGKADGNAVSQVVRELLAAAS